MAPRDGGVPATDGPRVRCVDAARCVCRPARPARAAARRCAAPERCSRPWHSLLSPHPVLMLPGRSSHLMPGWQRRLICLRRRRRCWPVRPMWSPGVWRKDCSRDGRICSARTVADSCFAGMVAGQGVWRIWRATRHSQSRSRWSSCRANSQTRRELSPARLRPRRTSTPRRY